MDNLTRMLLSSKNNATMTPPEYWTPSAGTYTKSFSPSRVFTATAYYKITSADTIAKAGDYATAAEYVGYLATKILEVMPAFDKDKTYMGNPIYLPYFSHTIAGDGRSGTVTYKYATTSVIPDPYVLRTNTWSVTMTINFTLA